MRPRQRSRAWWWGATVVWMAVIWTATSLPGELRPEGPPGADHVVHFLLYAPLGFLLLHGLWPTRGGCGRGSWR